MFAKLGLDKALLRTAKLTSLLVNWDAPDLGIDSNVYQQLLHRITVIVHNAWTLDFRAPLSRFESIIHGTTNLINLARRSCVDSLRFIFVSSIMAAQNYGFVTKVPEDLITDTRTCLGTGYGESKYIVERVLSRSGFNTCCVRIPQLYGGGKDGIWPASGWLPVLVNSSVTLKQIPTMGGVVDWLPMSAVATVLHQISTYGTDKLPSVINVCHSNPVPYADVIDWMKTHISRRSEGRINIRPMDIAEWTQKMEELQRNGVSPRVLPAMKLLGFIREVVTRDKLAEDKSALATGALPLLRMDHLTYICPSLMSLEPVAEATVSGWVDYWISKGYLSLRDRFVNVAHM
ncbi:hypothetical protein ONZ45_g13883 [Pleurotus djamor]|nr:hypothetical protein ONZ45_g13883 [Pleurotus djamor]